MSESYAKLFSTITASTIWGEPLATRVVWITMLAMADRNGDVMAAVPGLARIANVSLAECEAALETLRSPDRYSRTPDHEGRRITDVPGGFRLLNYAAYRERMSKDDRREQQRQWVADKRARERATEQNTPASTSTAVDNVDKSTESTHTDAEVEAKAVSQKLPTTSAQEAAPPEVQKPVVEPDPIFGHGLAFLIGKGVKERGARSFLGAMRKELGELLAAELLAAAEREDVSDPIPWLRKAGETRRTTGPPKKPNAADMFHGKTYTGTAIDDLPPELRDAVRAELAAG